MLFSGDPVIVKSCQQDLFTWRDGYTLRKLLIVVSMIALIAPLALFPHLLEARKAENEISAIRALRVLAACQVPFRSSDRDSDGYLDYATSLQELSQVGLIDNVLGGGVMSGYVFTLSGSTYEWNCSATPISSNTGVRNFIVCTDGVVCFSSSGRAVCSPCVE
ncbi:MAG: hypothetical protein O7H41_07275 [Planctomycetota bacterium]|nr:hypothetical protein [Planctomycetota bacterium]